MKKIFLFAILVAMSLSATVAFAQEVSSLPKTKKRSIQTTSSTSVGDLQIETKTFLLNVKINNETTALPNGFILKPNQNHSRMYLNGNWGTIDKKVEFSPDVKSNTVGFIVAYRVVKVGDLYKIYKEGVPCSEMDEFIGKNIFDDVLTKKLLVTAEFINSFGEKIKKDLEINLNQNSEPNGDEIFAEADVEDDDLGLNVVSLKVKPENLYFRFWLRNEEYGINMVVSPNNTKGTTKVSTLAGKKIEDGVYSFSCRVDLPNGIQQDEKIEAFVVNNEISISANSFNPLSFTRDTKQGGSYFNGKITVVKIKNTRSSSIIVFLPTDYVVGRVTFTTGKTEIQTEAFSQNGSGWVSYVIPAGESIKVKMKVGAFPIIVHDLNRNNSDIVMVGLMSKNFQYLDIGWGRRFTLRAR